MSGHTRRHRASRKRLANPGQGVVTAPTMLAAEYRRGFDAGREGAYALGYENGYDKAMKTLTRTSAPAGIATSARLNKLVAMSVHAKTELPVALVAFKKLMELCDREDLKLHVFKF
jgi:hypothetical protein